MKIFNCHTHIGDTFINLDKSKKWSVKELVGPPYGLKHNLLKKASEMEILQGMRKSIKIMRLCGVTHFCDFRESGVNGIKLLKKATEGTINCIILGRPIKNVYDKDEMNEILELSEGIGLSSISDWHPSELKKVATHVHKRKKMLGIHASEVCREDIHKILDLKPSFLVHMTKANPDDLKLIANKHIPVVICPSSNAFFGIKTNVTEMRRKGVKLMLGTDNAMVTPPNLAYEFDYLIKNFNVDINEAWKMITTIPEETFKL